VKLDLSSLTAINNTDQLVLKITFAAPNTGNSGNNRFDNITVEGDTLIGLPTAVLEGTATNGYSLYPNPSNDRINVLSPIDGMKQFSVTNAMGQLLYTTEQEGKQNTLNTSTLKNGVYYLTITNGEERIVLPFVKN